jgi:hypothetical protein
MSPSCDRSVTAVPLAQNLITRKIAGHPLTPQLLDVRYLFIGQAPPSTNNVILLMDQRTSRRGASRRYQGGNVVGLIFDFTTPCVSDVFCSEFRLPDSTFHGS